MTARATLLAAALLATGAAAACEPDLAGEHVARVEGGDLTLAFRADPALIVVGEPFALDIAICHAGDAPIALRRVDAEMPEHRHGMNYAPTVAAIGPRRFRAEGLLFHMPGRWRVHFELAGAPPRRLAADIRLD